MNMLSFKNFIILFLALAVYSEELLNSGQNYPQVEEKYPQNDYITNPETQGTWDSNTPEDQPRSARSRRREGRNFLENQYGYYPQSYGQNGNYPNYPYQQGYVPSPYPYDGPVPNPVHQPPFTYPDRYDYGRNSDRSQYSRSEGYRSFK